MCEPPKLLAFFPLQESRVHDYRHACTQQFPSQYMKTSEGSFCRDRSV
jgi:hypothetical protein